MVASLLSKQEATAKAWVNAGKVESVEEYYAQVKGTSASSQSHEEKPKRRRSRRKS